MGKNKIKPEEKKAEAIVIDDNEEQIPDDIETVDEIENEDGEFVKVELTKPEIGLDKEEDEKKAKEIVAKWKTEKALNSAAGGASIGMIVRFNDGKKELPAIITSVVDQETGKCRLHIFSDDHPSMDRVETVEFSTKHGDHNTWNWPSIPAR